MRDQGTKAASAADLPATMLKPRHKMPEGEAAIFAAARWLVDNRQRLRDEGKHPVAEMQRRFGISAKQAIEAIRHANAAEQRDD